MKILVVGAGVGGLAAARGLSAAGYRVEVFERAPALRTGGSAVTMWSNGSGILAELGVPLEDVGSRIDVLEQHDFTGRPLMRIDVSRAARRYGRPHLCLPRGRLVRRLSDGLPDGTLFFGRACTAIAHDGDGVHVEFADGSRATGDLLVGADGRRSVVRRHLWGEDPTRPTGWTTWQGLSLLPLKAVPGGVCRMLIGPEGTCGLMLAGEGLLQWWFDMPWRPDDVPPPSPSDVLRRRFGHWAPPVPDVLAAIRDEDVEFFPHHGHRVPRIWGEGRCTLVGDAAHTMPPSQAQGANQALEDAWALTRALRNPADLPSALRRYERRRSVKSGRVARAANLEATNIYRPFLTGLVPERLASTLYTRWLRAISDYLTDIPSLPVRLPGMDIEAASGVVARIAATGAIQGLSEDEARDVVTRIRARITGVFGSDARSLSELEEAVEEPSNEDRVMRLGYALTWYARRDPEFAADLAGWAADHTPATRRPARDRDPYVVTARDLTIERNSD